jgi:hypothetical protein
VADGPRPALAVELGVGLAVALEDALALGSVTTGVGVAATIAGGLAGP